MASVKGIFKAAFPFISAAASAGGPLATMAAGALAKGLGIDKVEVAKIEETIAAATAQKPELMLELKKCEQAFELQMRELGFESAAKIEEIQAADRASARAREIAVKDKTPAILAYAVTVGFFVLLALLCFHEVPMRAHDLVVVMIGSLGAAWVGIVTYYFGSSAGSAEKTKLMGKPAV